MTREWVQKIGEIPLSTYSIVVSYVSAFKRLYALYKSREKHFRSEISK